MCVCVCVRARGVRVCVFTYTCKKPMLSPFVSIFAKHSVYITHSAVNFTKFAPRGQQKFNDIPLFEPGALR